MVLHIIQTIIISNELMKDLAQNIFKNFNINILILDIDIIGFFKVMNIKIKIINYIKIMN